MVATKFHKLSLGNLIGLGELFVGGVVDFLRRTAFQLVEVGKEAEGPVDGEGNAGKGEDKGGEEDLSSIQYKIMMHGMR